MYFGNKPRIYRTNLAHTNSRPRQGMTKSLLTTFLLLHFQNDANYALDSNFTQAHCTTHTRVSLESKVYSQTLHKTLRFTENLPFSLTVPPRMYVRIIPCRSDPKCYYCEVRKRKREGGRFGMLGRGR